MSAPDQCCWNCKHARRRMGSSFLACDAAVIYDPDVEPFCVTPTAGRKCLDWAPRERCPAAFECPECGTEGEK